MSELKDPFFPEQDARTPGARRMGRSGGTARVLFSAGDRLAHVWRVEAGAVVLYRPAIGGPPARPRAVAVRRAGELVGVEGLPGGRHLRTAVALDGAELSRAGAGEFLASCGRGEVLSLAGSLAAPVLSETDGTAEQRAAAWLLDADGDDALLSLPLRVVADLVGIAGETLSRTLRSLAAAGAVDLSQSRRSRLAVLDRRALEAHLRRR
jgi:CRP-like cAMP-binding protein